MSNGEPPDRPMSKLDESNDENTRLKSLNADLNTENASLLQRLDRSNNFEKRNEELVDQKAALESRNDKLNESNGEYWNYVNTRCNELQPKYGLQFTDTMGDPDTRKWKVRLTVDLCECDSRVAALAVVEQMEELLSTLKRNAERQGGGVVYESLGGGSLTLTGGKAGSRVPGKDFPV